MDTKIENAVLSLKRKDVRLEMHLSSTIRRMLNKANDASLSGNCLAFLGREVRGQVEP